MNAQTLRPHTIDVNEKVVTPRVRTSFVVRSLDRLASKSLLKIAATE
jgi:hypothetical protein